MGKDMENERAEFRAGSGKASRRSPRRLVQLYAALLYNANLKGFIDGHIYSGPLKAACVPGFNCYSCPGAIASCPLGSLQNALSASGHTAPWYVLGILALFGVVLGRTICGWLCPLGLIQELLHRLPVPKVKKSAWTRRLSCLKYVFLAVFAVAIPVWYGIGRGVPLPGFCKYVCPAGTLEGAVGLLQNEANATSFYQLKLLFTCKWVILLAIGLACAFCYRAFCRFICPLGAIYGFFNRFALTGVRVDPNRCNGCGLCVRRCPMDVKHVGDHECISCGKCVESCAQGAIALKAGRLTLAGPEPVGQGRGHIGRIAWGFAIAVLLFAVAWFNWIEPARTAANPVSDEQARIAAPSAEQAEVAPSAEQAEVASSAEQAEVSPSAEQAEEESASGAPGSGRIGTEVGDVLPDFRTELLGGGAFHLADCRGRVVVLNFWAITCAPCIEELPFYEQLKQAQPEVEVLAIHHRVGAKKAEAFLADKGWDHIDFALDSKEKGLYALLGASDALPSTIVLNGAGEIVYHAQAPLTLEQLEALVEQAR